MINLDLVAEKECLAQALAAIDAMTIHGVVLAKLVPELQTQAVLAMNRPGF